MILNSKILMIVFLLVLPGWAGAASVTDDMQKLGQGEAYYLGFIKVYNASLYGTELAEVKGVLSDDVSKCLHLEYVVDLDKEDFITAANKVLSRQFSEEQLARARRDIEILHQGYRDVQDGDSYTLCYNSANKATTLSHNGGVLVSVNSADFAEIYFSIWLGETDPLDESLRDDLLGVQGS